MPILAAIQAGGRSARMGTDKAWVELQGLPLIEHVLRAARPCADRLALVISRTQTHDSRYAELARTWQAELLEDWHDYRGPLGGLHTALRHCAPGETALMLACDLPFVSAAFLQLLQTKHAALPPVALTFPLDRDGRRQMLAGLYETACLPHITELLAADRLRVDGLLQHLHAREITFADYAHLPNAAQLLSNLNTPEELGAVRT